MIKKLIQSGLMLAALMFVCVPSSVQAIGVSISSTASCSACQPIPAFLARRGDSISATMISTGGFLPGTTAQLESSTNFSNWKIEASTAVSFPGVIGLNLTGVSLALGPVNQDTYYRWNVLQSSGGAAIYTISDNDDPVVPAVKNNKQADTFGIFDDSVRIMGASLFADIYTLQPSSGGSAISLSSSTQMVWRTAASTTNYRSYSGPGGMIPLDKSFTIIGTTGSIADVGVGNSGISLSATPTISTATAINGDQVMFIGAVSSITFSDNGTLVGSALKLGATTRAVGLGDMLGLIYLNGFWREEYFVNNFQ